MSISFKFDESYFNNELREDFEVSSLMKRCWAAGMQTISDMAIVCRRHNIEWFAFCGTLLGAVRHNGFIPWDDDVDIAMKRSDYNKFLAYAKQEMPSFYSIETYDEYDFSDKQNYVRDYDGITRINTCRLPDFNPDHMDYFHGFPYPSGIDLYPLDYIPDDVEISFTMVNLHKMVSYIRLSMKENAAQNHDLNLLKWENLSDEIKFRISEIEKVIGQQINKNTDILFQLDQILDAISSLGEESESSNLSCITHYIYEAHHMIFPKECFEHAIEMPFESGNIMVPIGYTDVLRINYGKNYMTPNKIFIHDYPYYKKWEPWVQKYVSKNPELSEIMSPYYYPDI